jgi:hypothetical protein
MDYTPQTLGGGLVNSFLALSFFLLSPTFWFRTHIILWQVVSLSLSLPCLSLGSYTRLPAIPPAPVPLEPNEAQHARRALMLATGCTAICV